MSKTVIEVSHLSKNYKGGKQAVKDISFSVSKGEFFAFLGPNGAGKSTTIKILTTLMKPTSGQAQIAGCDLSRQAGEIRLKIGVALQTTAIDPMLTGRELITLQGRLFGFSGMQAAKRASELLELVNLTVDADRQCGKYSGGMQRRLDLALTLVHRPEILFLDEPTVGLDPLSRIEIWNEIKKLNKEFGTTIFLTTQYLDEADQVADKVCIINDGVIVAMEKPDELKRSLAFDKIVISFATMAENERAKAVLSEIIAGMEEQENGLNLYVENSDECLPIILRKISEAQLFPKHIAVTAPTLDDVFLQLMRNQMKTRNERMKSHVG